MNDRLSRVQASRSAAIKASLHHPVIDTDVHVNDYAPVLEDYIQHYGGNQLVDALRKALGGRFVTRTGGGKDWYQQTPEERQYHRTLRAPWWARVTRNTYDLATYTLPALLYERLAEQGSDYSVLFPNDVLSPAAAGSEYRQPLHRAINHFHADQYRAYADRLTPVAGIPLYTPQEGIEELEFAVKTLGLKVINIAGGVRRPIRAIADKYPAKEHPEVARQAGYIDFYGIDSEHDYDPFWAKVVELGVPVTTHYGSQGWTGRQSISNYMNNHIGHFADGSQAFAKALFFGGVTRRFPGLRVGLLEGGADWGAHVFTHLVDRWEKRNRVAVRNYDPAEADVELLASLFERYGADYIKGRANFKSTLLRDSLGISALPHSREPDASEIDDFAMAGIEKVEDIRDRWVSNFYFGSEADDRTVAAAFNDRVNPLGTKINAIWSSDVGHWDVPEFTEPLAESWDLVEQGVISAADFKALVFDNPHRFYTEANPRFFEGTEVGRKLSAAKA
ncbi:putative metal-dependent hydrolase of the TIM-barrel fold protein [Variovorax sp. PBS-H4]|uniref:amidohydrolase family protein n=1 Tax=Variovorax sp. PBS-H4 TaxID=434008 RepID=UPI001315F87F|nr:amidohydrolase family protein [Variovorax sp. PBS-H4]VTU38956.1 putative metal-dependent hydrolase of the TIM-barrel fold protein [Variovorax sp. PBS-H4]